jgi:hypothetical protein
MNKPLVIGIVTVSIFVCMVLAILYFLGIFEKKSPGGLVTYSKLGQNGRLGNQLFQIAAVIGAVNGDLSRVVLPDWKYKTDFTCTEYLVFDKLIGYEATTPEMDAFQYMPIVSPTSGMDVNGYRQNIKYFSHVLHKIREIFMIPAQTKHTILKTLPILQFDGTCIGIHVRRGDYVSETYSKIREVCTKSYYYESIRYMRMKGGGPVIVVSDDILWCKQTFSDIPNVFYSPFDTEILDMFTLSLCRYTILSNSSFSFWGTLLGPAKIVTIAPWPWIKDGQRFEEVYLPEWRVVDTVTGTVKQEGYDYFSPDIGAFYQCYRQPRAMIAALSSFRNMYPASSLHIVRDGGGDDCLQNIALYFNASRFHSLDTQLGNGVTNALHSKFSAMTFVQNLIRAAQQMKETYFILLEDDICVLHRIGKSGQVPDWWGKYDLIGCNGKTAKMNPATLLLLPGPVTYSYYGGCGGSLFRTSFWAQHVHLDDPKLDRVLDAFGTANGNIFHSDILLSFLCVLYGGTIRDGPPPELIESETSIPSSACILHQYKYHYDKQPSQNDMFILS